MRLRWAAASIALATGIAATASPAFAGIPDWAKEAAEAAPPVDEGSPEWPERTLLATTSIAVSPDGATWKINRRRVTQVLSNRVSDLRFEYFGFDDTTKIKKSKGWHVPPGERAHRNVGGAADLTLPTAFLTDAKARTIALEGVRKGSLIVCEFEAESHPYTETDFESFYEAVPVSLARWSIALPAGWTLKYAWLPGPGPEPTHEGATWTFTQRDFVPPRDETLGESAEDLGPRLVVALQPPEGASSSTPAFGNWDAVGRWYQELAKGSDAATPAIQAAVKDMLAKAGPAPLDRIRAVSLFVRDRVRYLDREVGIGGFQPHAASQVFSELYGDCKDKGTLLRAALHVAGYDAYPMLIHATNAYAVSPDVPVPGAFNHFVVGVVWPKDAPFPEEAASARVDAGDAGMLLVVDPTDERAWPGTLPDNLAGKTALAVVGQRGMLLALPDAKPDWHRIARTATVAIAKDRAVSMELVSRYYGGPAEEARSACASSFKDRREAVEADLRRSWAGAEIKDYKVTTEDKDGAYVETVSLAIPPTAPALQDKTFWLFAGATGDIERVALGKRKSTVLYPYPFSLRYEMTLTGAPLAGGAPNPVRQSGAGWSVASTYRIEGAALHAVWSAQLSTPRFEPAAFPDLKQFWSAAGKAAGQGLTLPE